MLLAAATYVYGYWTGHFLSLRPTFEYCTSKPLADPPLEWHLFPLQNSCRWQDGSSTDLVPAFVNPVILACLVLAAVIAWLSALMACRRRTLPESEPAAERRE